MNRSWRTITLMALVGLGVLVLAQAPAQAQYRAPFVRPPVAPLLPPSPRAFVATPPPVIPLANSYTYLYPQGVPSGLNLNQVAALNALRIQTRLYNSLYSPYRTIYGTPIYPMNPYLTGVLYNPYNPYNLYNPYFAAYGLGY
jgi:hypothetical protein